MDDKKKSLHGMFFIFTSHRGSVNMVWPSFTHYQRSIQSAQQRGKSNGTEWNEERVAFVSTAAQKNIFRLSLPRSQKKGLINTICDL